MFGGGGGTGEVWGLLCVEMRGAPHPGRISRQAKGQRCTLTDRGRGLVCLDVRAYRARDSISRRAKGQRRTLGYCGYTNCDLCSQVWMVMLKYQKSANISLSA